MQLKMNVTVLGVVALIMIPAAHSAAGEDGFKDIKNQVVTHTLDNGLKLIMLPRHDAPVFSFATIFNVGSADDPKGQTGLAHMFEHMAFKGTTYIGTNNWNKEKDALVKVDEAFEPLRMERLKGVHADEAKLKELEEALKLVQDDAGQYVKTNEFPNIIGQMGGVGMNAGTAMDMTIYFYSMPSNKLEVWMSLESERFFDPVLREFYKEADVVKEERRMRIESQPIGKLVEELLTAAYKGHPYGIPGVGFFSDLSTFNTEDAQAFYKKYYVPNNMTIALVGDIDPKKTIKLAEAYFGRMKKGPQPLPIRTVEPKQESERMVTVYGDGQDIVMAGYHMPDGRDPDAPVYEVLSSILSEGRTSRLYKRLVDNEKKALFAGGFSGFPGTKYPSLFVFFGLPNKGVSSEDLLASMEEEVRILQQEKVGEDELKRVKTKARADLIRSLSSNSGLAMALAQNQVLLGAWQATFDSLDKIQAVSAEDIQRVAKKTFTRSNRTLAFYKPKTAESGGEQ